MARKTLMRVRPTPRELRGVEKFLLPVLRAETPSKFLHTCGHSGNLIHMSKRIWFRADEDLKRDAMRILKKQQSTLSQWLRERLEELVRTNKPRRK